MGKRKQKVRWSSVDGISWSNGDQVGHFSFILVHFTFLVILVQLLKVDSLSRFQ